MTADLATTAPPLPKTVKGRATYERILRAAATLVHERGVAQTSMDDVREATGTSKSQLYHYFADKSALVCAVIAWNRGAVLAAQQPYLDEISTLAGLHAWADHLVGLNEALTSYHGCPIGSIAAEVSDHDQLARATATAALAAWQQALADGIGRIIADGELPADCDADGLALGLLTAVQGGELLSQAQQSPRPLQVALDHALAGVDALARR